jgi:dihydroorotate dehydrogenase electron transfer subunit
MIGMTGSDILLRRPFSVCGLPGTFEDAGPDTLQILYKVVGRGTALMASLKPGAPVSVLGPLGRGFQAPAPGARPVFVAGGIGSAPFPVLAKRLDKGPRPLLLYGARSVGDLPLLHWFRESAEVVVTTDDGSLGRKALVTVPLEELLREEAKDASRLHVYACGPTPMLRAVGRIALAAGVRCDLSLEAPMACGFGVCLGCVVPVHAADGSGTRFERVCVEGPVMDAARLAW